MRTIPRFATSRRRGSVFAENLQARLRKLGLELHPNKTRLVEFGRSAEQNRERRGQDKPETFEFLGFTHISGKNGKGHYAVRRTTVQTIPAPVPSG